MKQHSEEAHKAELDHPDQDPEELSRKFSAKIPFHEQIDPFEPDPHEEFEYDEPEFRIRAPRKRIGIFCFNCNRREGHFLYRQNSWYYSYLIGLTFGLIKIIGPYQCQCCGARRFMCADWLHSRYLRKKQDDRKRMEFEDEEQI